MQEMPIAAPSKFNKPLPGGHFEKELDYNKPRTPREWMKVINNYIGENVYSLELDEEDLARKKMSWPEFKIVLRRDILLMGPSEKQAELYKEAIRFIENMIKKGK